MSRTSPQASCSTRRSLKGADRTEGPGVGPGLDVPLTEEDNVPEWDWFVANLLVGVPLAAFGVCLLRESVRSALALALGFRVFEIRLGVGQPRAHFQLGPLDFACAPIALAGATIAHSARAPRHRIDRMALAVTPIGLQLVWIGTRLLSGSPPGGEPLYEGPAPLACLEIANALTLVLHLTCAVELPGGLRTDIRLFLDALVGPAGSERAARASYYARLSRHHLERSDVADARRAVRQGIRQLGPEPLLVEAERLLRRSALDSVIDQLACADALRRAIKQSEPRRRRERASWSRRERLRQSLYSLLPIALAISTLAVIQADRLVHSLEHGLIRVSERIGESGDPRACEAMDTRWHQWSTRIDPLRPPQPGLRSDRQLSRASLALCRGDRESAERHEASALLAANEAVKQMERRRNVEPADRLGAELQVTRLMRRLAEREGQAESHRDALRTLARAERRLIVLRGQLGALEPDAREAASYAIRAEAEAIEQARERLRGRLAAL